MVVGKGYTAKASTYHSPLGVLESTFFVNLEMRLNKAKTSGTSTPTSATSRLDGLRKRSCAAFCSTQSKERKTDGEVV